MRAALLALSVVLAIACGSKSKPAETAPTPTETAGSGSAAPSEGETCAALKGNCTARVATVACKEWKDTSDCSGDQGCCIQ